MIGPLGGSAGSYSLGGALQIRPPQFEVPAVLQPGSKASSLSIFTSRFLDARSSFEGLDLASRMRVRFDGSGSATASSATSPSLGLDLTESFGTLTSTEEVNTTPTSFSPVSPAFAGSSTTTPTIGGEYDGAQGDDTLTFSVAESFSGTVGSNFIAFRVTDGSGSLVDVVTYSAEEGAGTEKTLSNGLTLSLSDGVAAGGDSFTVDVFASVGSSIDPDAALDGVGNQSAGFEEGTSVTAGTFEVEGETISVDSGDSLNDVLAKITASAAGISAAYDAGTERVTLTRTSSGPGKIVLSGDTTGLLEAIKLDGASTVEGATPDNVEAIADVASLAGIASGTLEVNGTELTIDVLTDSLEDVVAAINAADAGVTADYDEAEDTLALTSTDGSPFELGDGTSGFFAALGISEGTYATAESGGKSYRQLRDEGNFRRELDNLADNLEVLFGGSYGLAGSFQLSSTERALETAIRGALEGYVDDTGEDVLETEFGITFRFDGAGPEIEIDQLELGRAIERDPEGLASLLLGARDQDAPPGLLEELEGAFDSVATGLLAVLTPEEAVGLTVDLSA